MAGYDEEITKVAKPTSPTITTVPKPYDVVVLIMALLAQNGESLLAQDGNELLIQLD